MPTASTRSMESPADPPVAGVRTLDHTADVGIEVRADTAEELFRRAALGALWMVLEHPHPEQVGTAETQTIEVRITAPDGDLAALLRAWLRDVLYRCEVEDFVAAEFAFDRLGSGGIEARVTGAPATTAAVREIKGVTWHGLLLESDPWRARVIFDV